MNKVIKTIGIDARFYGPVGKGLGRYTQEIVDFLSKNDTGHNYVIFLGKQNFADFVVDNQRVKKVLADVRWYGLAEQMVMPRLIRQHQIDLMHFPHFNVPIFCPCDFVVTIHDLILTKYPTIRATTLNPFIYQLKNLAYRIIIHRAVVKAKKLITVSEFTKKDIIDNFKIKPQRIIVTYEGVAKLSNNSSRTNIEVSQIISKFEITKKYLLYVGNAYPHKNLVRLLSVARPILKKHDLQLALVGKIDYFYQRLVETVNNWPKAEQGNVIFTGFVNDEELEMLYQQALLYIFPSLYEGFGLPPLEAMARSCPVLSSNRSSMPEILGKSACYFDPEDEKDMTGQLEKMITSANLRETMTNLGLKQVKMYNWENCATETLAVYNSVL